MRQFTFPEHRWSVVGMVIVLVSSTAGAVNINGNGASLNLPTTDISSGTAQSNGVGARLVLGGTPVTGIVSTNGVGAKVVIEPMNAVAGDNGAPTADFSAYPLSGSAPLTVEFTSLATGGIYEITSWAWNFGDGSPICNEQNPTHIFSAPGSYTVTLTVTSPGGDVSATKEDYITATQGLPTANTTGVLLMIAVVMILGSVAARNPSSATLRLRVGGFPVIPARSLLCIQTIRKMLASMCNHVAASRRTSHSPRNDSSNKPWQKGRAA